MTNSSVNTSISEKKAAQKVESVFRNLFWASKRVFDIFGSLLLMPLFGVFIVVLAALNPWFNPGPLFFTQIRMGQNCRAFRTYKFRTMHDDGQAYRKSADPIEVHRITKLGAFMRKTRIDELPQIINVLCAQMSLIGPRPDVFSHARVFIRAIPEYRDRYCVRPGISGLAQVKFNYTVGTEATRQKVLTDLEYIKNAGFGLETWIVLRTIITILSKAGA